MILLGISNGRGLYFRSLLVGILVSLIVAVSSVYIAFMLSALPWPIIISVIMSYTLLKIVGYFSKRKPNIHEANVAQAAGSIGGLVGASIVFTIPAILFLGKSISELPSPLIVFVVSALGGLLGVSMSLHVRRITLDVENLPFPSGTAGAEVLLAVEETARARPLFIALLFSFVVSSILLFLIGFPLISTTVLLGGVIIVISLYASLAAIGAGYIINYKPAISWFAGSIIGWVFLSALFQTYGVDISLSLVYVQRLGIGIVFGFGFAFLLTYIVGGVAGRGAFSFKTREDILFLPISALALIVLLVIGIDPIAAILSILGAWVMSFIAGKTTGETDIDPLEQFGLFVGLAVLGALYLIGLSISIVDLVLLIMFVSAAASLAGDIGHDFKSARIIGTRDRDIFWIDFIAVVIGGSAAVLATYIVLTSYLNVIINVPSVAFQSKLVAAVLSSGTQPLTFYIGLLVGFIVGILPLMWKKMKVYSPLILPFGIGLFLGPALAIPIVIGGIIAFLHKDRKKGIVVASGLLAGEGLSGFIIGLLKIMLL